MKLFRFSIASLSLLMMSVLAAQTPAAPRPDQQPAPRVNQPGAPVPDAADMTIVGCLAQAKDDDDTFTLTVSPAPAAQQAAGATAATGDATRATNPDRTAREAARAANAPNPTIYIVVGLDDDELKPHVNHQVELKGRVSASSASAGLSQAPTAKEFRASSMKMLSATCPPAK